MAVEYQVIIIYAATKKYLLDIPVENISRFQTELFDYLKDHCPQIPESIRTQKVMEEETEKSLIQAIEEFKKQFR